MANNDIWQVTDKQRYNGQEVLNVYYYRSDNVADLTQTSETLAGDFIATVLPTITLLQDPTLTHTAVEVQNLFNPSDSFTAAISIAGNWDAADQDQLSMFNALPFRLIGSNGAVKNGAKRLGGLVEAQQTDGVLTNPAAITRAQDAADAMLEPLDGGVIGTFFPVIVKRILDGLTYRLPTTPGEAIFSLVTDVIFDVLLTSQTSRKIGSGS